VIGRTGAAGRPSRKSSPYLIERIFIAGWLTPLYVAGRARVAARACHPPPPRREWPNCRWYGGLLANGPPREYKGYAN